MELDSVVGYAYGVQVKDAPHSLWRTRYGWFREKDGGKKRAQDSLRAVREETMYADSRMVRRFLSIEVIED